MRLGDGQDLADAGPEDFGDVNEFLGVKVLGERCSRSDERG